MLLTRAPDRLAATRGLISRQPCSSRPSMRPRARSLLPGRSIATRPSLVRAACRRVNRLCGVENAVSPQGFLADQCNSRSSRNAPGRDGRGLVRPADRRRDRHRPARGYAYDAAFIRDPASTSGRRSPGLCARLLDANLFAESSGAGTYALDDEGRVCLLRHIPLEDLADRARLRNVIGRFAAAPNQS
jgi:hypothetical protein